MTKEDEELQLKFDPQTIEHLGIKMYSQLPYALAELVANAYDASASKVQIKLYDAESTCKRIVVIDDGEGMSYEEIRDNFLVIGRKRRATDTARSNSKNRKITGRKGLGKLALFGIGKTIRIETTKSGQTDITAFTLDWDAIISEESGTYRPATERVAKSSKKRSGTIFELSNLSRITDFDLDSTAASLARLFNCFSGDFIVEISRNDGDAMRLTRDFVYANLTKEFEWNVEEILALIDSEYQYKAELKGKIFTTKKPIKQDLRGIALYVNGRLANIPSFFGTKEAGYAFSYMTGWIDADYLDEFEKDLISTDRQSLSWDMPDAQELEKCLAKIVRHVVNDWGARRASSKQQIASARSGVNIPEWYSKVPEEILPRLRTIIDNVSTKPQLDDEDFSAVVAQVHALIPPYTYFHYRALHEQIKAVARPYYEAANFYNAFHEALKRYINAIKDKSGTDVTDEGVIVERSFGKGKLLETTAIFKTRPNGQPFRDRTIENIEEGQLELSRGIVKGGRHVLAHEEIADLLSTGLFTEKDCLDLLSLLSHLFKRLDESKKR